MPAPKWSLPARALLAFALCVLRTSAFGAEGGELRSPGTRTLVTLGYARVDYRESWIELSLGAACVQVDHARYLSFLEFSGTAFSLFAPSRSDGHSMSFAGLDLRAGPFFRPSRQVFVSLLAGYSYLTTFTSAPLGFVDLNGFEFGPTLRALVAGRHRIELALKLVPSGDGLEAESAARSTTVGVTYCAGSMSEACLSWSVMYQAATVSVGGREVGSSLFSVGVGYAF
ncbi:MAG TPA: hypothetical protein VM598_13270 [Bdellovibrionota bacterium]|nr:hypothetical protein [Bdellovibrionota bacterium]